MVGLFVVGGALLQTGLAREGGNRMMSLAKGSERRAFLLVMLSTSFIGAFVSNTGTVALMMPIVVSMSAQAGFSSSRLLMPLAFASSLGGMLTLIGTPPNLVVSEALEKAGYQPLGFFAFLPVGLIVIALGIIMLLPMSRQLVKEKSKKRRKQGKSLDDLVDEYQLEGNLHKYSVPAHSKLVGCKVADLDLSTSSITIVEIRNERKNRLGLRDVSQSIVSGDTVIEGGDILYLIGNEEGMGRLAKAFGLVHIKGAQLDFYDIGLAELVVLPASKLVNTAIHDSRLREKYRVNVLGIRRGHEYIFDNLGDTRLHDGDVLLVQAQWDDLLQLNSDADDWVVLGRPDKTIGKVTLDYKAPVAAAIMLLMVLLMVVDWIPVAPVTAVLLAAVLTIVSGCFRSVDAAYKTINWQSVILIAAMMPMSTALEKTGVSSVVSEGLVQLLGNVGPDSTLGRHLFHDVSPYDVYQQHGHGCAYGSNSSVGGSADRRLALCFPHGSNTWCKHVLCLTVLYPAQCIGDEGRAIQLYRLRESGAALASGHWCCHDVCASASLPLLTDNRMPWRRECCLGYVAINIRNHSVRLSISNDLDEYSLLFNCILAYFPLILSLFI